MRSLPAGEFMQLIAPQAETPLEVANQILDGVEQLSPSVPHDSAQVKRP
jgi:hypothetical protein